MRDNPWALEFLDQGRAIIARERRARGGEAEDNGEEDLADAEAADPLMEVDAMLAAMAEAKDAANEADENPLFRTRPLMGKWTLEHTGMVCDAYQCRATDPWRGLGFLLRVGHRPSTSFQHELVWCRWGTHLLQVLVREGGLLLRCVDGGRCSWQSFR